MFAYLLPKNVNKFIETFYTSQLVYYLENKELNIQPPDQESEGEEYKKAMDQ